MRRILLPFLAALALASPATAHHRYGNPSVPDPSVAAAGAHWGKADNHLLVKVASYHPSAVPNVWTVYSRYDAGYGATPLSFTVQTGGFEACKTRSKRDGNILVCPWDQPHGNAEFTLDAAKHFVGTHGHPNFVRVHVISFTDPLWQLCMELSHALGLDHRRDSSSSCMNYNGAGPYPDQHDVDEVRALQNHQPTVPWPPPPEPSSTPKPYCGPPEWCDS